MSHSPQNGDRCSAVEFAIAATAILFGWTEQLRARRPLNVAIVAQANKTARTIWPRLAHGTKYEQAHISTRPA